MDQSTKATIVAFIGLAASALLIAIGLLMLFGVIVV